MRDSKNKFLLFNGQSIYVLNKDGQYWIAIRPICSALNVNYDRQFKNLKADTILSGVYAIQHTHDATERLQKMVCLPEKYIYGWLFSIRSSSADLAKYKQECYDVLYNHFHGSITLLSSRLKLKEECKSKEIELREQLRQNPMFLQYEDAQKQVKKANDLINATKSQIVNHQLGLFQN